MSRPSDIIVVGAGIVGCAIAHELASARRELNPSADVSDERLHEARKHIKRARALLRLVAGAKLAESVRRMRAEMDAAR